MSFIIKLSRYLKGRSRPSRRQNQRYLEARGESLSSLIFRDATSDDIPKLAALHVKTWNATYPSVRKPPTFATREWQWREAFDKNDGSWFCIVVENRAGELIGFAKGIFTEQHAGDLSKIYLLWEYHRLGLGRKLVGIVVRRFMERGVNKMMVVADGKNPSCNFYEKLGAVHLTRPNGRISQGGYVWHDLAKLSAICPVG